MSRLRLPMFSTGVGCHVYMRSSIRNIQVMDLTAHTELPRIVDISGTGSAGAATALANCLLEPVLRKPGMPIASVQCRGTLRFCVFSTSWFCSNSPIRSFRSRYLKFPTEISFVLVNKLIPNIRCFFPSLTASRRKWMPSSVRHLRIPCV